MARCRLRFTEWPSPAIEWTDTPQPDCRDCGGRGGWEQDYGDSETGDYAGTHDVPCGCWDSNRRRLRITRVPVWVARRWFGYVPPDPHAVAPF